MNYENYDKFISSFNDNHKKVIDSIESSNNLTSIFESAIAECDYIKKCICDFFSYNGAREEIRSMYESVDSRDNNWKTINTCDLDNCRVLYDNYTEGMMKYIGELSSMESVDNKDEICKKISSIRNNDKLFLESIFGGKNNESKEQSIFEAVKNIECLIDLIDTMEKCKSYMESIDISRKDVNRDAVMVECGKLYTESVSNYFHKTVSWIISDYKSIQESIHSKKEPLKVEFAII